MPTPETGGTPLIHAHELQALLDRFPAAPADGDSPLHLFHAANSICAQKVRTVLAHHGIPYRSHLLNIFAGDTYDPAYVRVRMAGCAAAGLALARRHAGTTSVASAGCDGCVVPTLVDAATGTVTVDSLRICMAVDAMAPGDTLVPADLAEAIMATLRVVDDLPNYQHLAVRVIPAAAPRNAFAQSKVVRCDALLAEHGADPVLRDAYEAKRAKEQEAAETLFDDTALAGARQAVADALAGVEAQLARSPGPWLFGDRLTMADLIWGVELVRAEDVGQAGFWQDGRLPRLAGWYARLCALPALRAAVIDFPGARLAPPTPEPREIP